MVRCPYCNLYMEEGTLNAGGYRILWSKEKNRWSSYKKPGDVELQKYRVLSAKSDTVAYICTSCRAVVVKY